MELMVDDDAAIGNEADINTGKCTWLADLISKSPVDIVLCMYVVSSIVQGIVGSRSCHVGCHRVDWTEWRNGSTSYVQRSKRSSHQGLVPLLYMAC
jgi:hypothetical protein